MAPRVFSADPRITQQFLQQKFRYDPVSGLLLWRAGRFAGRNAGRVHPSGYRQVNFWGQKYMAHRLIWLLQTGRWPILFLDHRNRDKTDNHWCNLREATASQNMMNREVAASRTGHRGVVIARNGRWGAQMKVNGQMMWFGTYSTIDEAIDARRKAAAQYFGDFYDQSLEIVPGAGQAS